MTRVILQPASDDHFRKTVRSAVPLSKIIPFFDEKVARSLTDLYPEGARVWGVTPGEDSRNAKKWDRFEIGDLVLFCGDGKAFASAFVRYKLKNPSLARALWGEDEKGQTWEYIYFVSPPERRALAYREMNSVIGYSPDFVYRGVMLLSDEKSKALVSAFGLIDD